MKWKELLEIRSGKNQKTVIDPNGQYPIYGSGGIIGYATEYLCPPKTTIVGRKGTINSPIFVNESFWNVDTAFGLIPSSKLLPKYLYYFCCHFNFTALDKSTTIPSLAKRDLENIEMNVPPLDEQSRIVTRIDELFSELDKAVDTLKTTKEQLAVYRQAILQQAFIGNSNYHKRKSSIPKAEFKPVDAKELVQLASLPQEWKYVYLSDLGNLSRGKSSHRPRNDPKLFENGVYPFFQTGDVKGAQKDLYNCEKKYNDVGLAQSKLWPAGTLCITIAANIAETCFLGVDGCFPDSIVGFIPNDNLVLKEYIRFFIEASKLKLWAYAPATAQKNINLSTLENLIVPYCGIEEQQYIVQKIEEIDSVCNKLEQTIDIALAQADAMRQSILKQAFEEKD